jgi:hypothetical protein
VMRDGQNAAAVCLIVEAPFQQEEHGDGADEGHGSAAFLLAMLRSHCQSRCANVTVQLVSNSMD